MKTLTKNTAIATTILLSSALFLAAPAKADTNSAPLVRESTVAEAVITAPTSAKLTFERAVVTTIPAPVAPVEPAPVLTEAAPVEEVAAQSTVPTPTQTLSPPKAVVQTPKASASGKGATIVAAAYAQLGVPQDCTALVSNSLAAVGIHFHDWPAGYTSLGTVIPASQAQPGDLAYYANGGTGLAHIAVYVGNGMAVHGGWNGGTTALASVNIGSGPVFIRVA